MNRKLLGGILAAGLSVATLGALPLGAEAGSSAKASTALTAPERANEAGRNLIKSKAPQLKVSASEKFSLIGEVVSTKDGLQYAAYNRTHEGLPVIGGDFVVTTNNKGQILGTSVAQKAKIGDLSVTPAVSSAKASAVTKAQVTKVVKTTSPKLVVWAFGKARLAWETSVSGEKAGKTAVKKVYVDARTGKVLRAVDELAHGEGTGYYNGPNPLPITVSQSGSTYSMSHPNIDGYVCQDAANNSTFTGPDDKFGNGQQTSRETGCADAYYAVEQENAMLSDWLGRDSFDGSGGAWPMRVGLDDVNAYYCPQNPLCGGEQVQIGHNQAGANNWISAMDVVAHEMGHGIDHHTGSGGVSQGKTQEFVADVMGTLTEHYDNQGSSYDPPDYTIGEEVNLVGAGPIRVMYKPDTVSGHPNCYSSSLPSSVHAAAGPGNHWFYLLAEGSAPAGKPASPTCDGSTLTGIGIEKAGKIFYNAMLQKNSNASYPNYRVWTLNAAKNLYPGSCTEFNKVKAAWTAISVPAQASEPTCTTSGNTVSVTNPGNKSGVVGTAATLQMTGSSSGGGALTWSATGLPAGLSINATSGLISGTPTTAGTFNVVVTGKDSTNAQGTASFTWTITGGGTPAVTLANSIALNNCSASLVRYPSSQAGDKALMLTNGHCYEGGFIDPGVHYVDRASTRSGTLLKADGTSAGTVTSERLIYATMTGTDVALYRLNETFSALQSRTGGAPYTIAASKAANGIEITIPSGYHKRIWDCSLNGFTDLRENGWNWKESLRYDADCDTIPGTSGSPIIGDASGEVVGINNTGNEDGAMCTLNNPCEVAPDGTTTAHQGQSYGQQTFVINTCINSSRALDLTLAGCQLQGGAPPVNTVTVTNPGNKTGTVGTAVTSVQIQGSSSGGGALTYTATGLPAGLSISTSGLISGTPTTAGTFNVTVTGKDSTNATGSTTFTWTIASGPGGGTVLTNGVAKTGISGASGSNQVFTLQVPAGATGLKFVTTGGTGDSDLYVKFGSAPTTTTYDCRSIGSSNAETCNIPSAQAGTYHVLVRGYSTFSGVSLTGSFTPPAAGSVLTNGVPKTGLSGAAGASQVFTLQVPAGATGLKFVTTGGTGDADLYVRFGSAPTTTSYTCRSIGSTNAETCNISTAQAGTYYVMVRGYSAFSGVSLTGSFS